MKPRNYGVLGTVFMLFAGLAVCEASKYPPPPTEHPIQFGEIWAYLMHGEEKFLVAEMPISDIAYFSARIDPRGNLYAVPPVSLLSSFTARKHLVVAEVSNQALTHFILSPDYPLMAKLLGDITAAAGSYDGVQIDFEAVPAYDKTQFLSFLTMLKKNLETKTLSVAIPARAKALQDAYDYASIAAIADRVIVMAYDEHWSGSAPGSIASLAWSEKVVNYASGAIGTDRLVMGMPFYGRAWGDKNFATAYKHSSASRIMAERGIVPERDGEGIPFFRFSETVAYALYFEDRESFARRSGIYAGRSVSKISVWRLGQEDPGVWACLKLPPPTKALRVRGGDFQAR